MIFPRRLTPPPDPPPRPVRAGTEAVAFSGRDPDGDPAGFDPAVAAARSVLLFLTTSCEGCRPLWAGVAGGAPPGLTVVTPDPETDSRRRARQLAGEGAAVIMSSQAWHRYGVTGSPWLVVVENGSVVGDGPAPHDWAEVVATASGSQTSLDC